MVESSRSGVARGAPWWLLTSFMLSTCSLSVPAPSVRDVEPATVFQQAETVVVAHGGFEPKVKVDFQQLDASTRDVAFVVKLEREGEIVSAPRVVFLGHEALELVVPSGLAVGSWSLRVIDPHGHEGALANALTVVDCRETTCVRADGGIIDAGEPDAGFEEDAGPPDAGPQPCAMVTLADDDGDGFGRPGSEAMLCGSGRTLVPGDCDDVDPGVFPNAPEFCNRVDDDCDTLIDEGVCPVQNPNWIRHLDSPTDKDWKTTSVFAPQRVWVAGKGDVWVRADGGYFEAASVSCPNELRASWAAPSGQLFVGGGNPALGRLADHALGVPACANGRMVSDPIAGLWGVTSADGGLEIAGVLRNARRFTWAVGGDAVEQPTNLTDTDLHFEGAHRTDGTELIVGGSNQDMRVYSWSGSAWTRERLDRLNLPSGVLRAVWVVSSTSAFAVGDRGIVLERVGRAWRQLPSPSGAMLTSVRAFNPARVYVTGADGTIRRWNGRGWQLLYTAVADGGVSLNDLDGPSESDLWAVGSRGWVVHWPE